MGNIFSDIAEDIELKPNKSKILIKWLIRIGVVLICGAFVLGQVKISSLTKINNFEKSLQQNTKAIDDLNNKMNVGFKSVNERIDKAYDNGSKVFTDYVTFNKEQLKVIIDYGQSNKELLKKMLDLNTLEKAKTVENQLQEAKSKRDTVTYTPSIIVQKKEK
jgi:hypothetical protein